jgi:putative transposon-encoded protein
MNLKAKKMKIKPTKIILKKKIKKIMKATVQP